MTFLDGRPDWLRKVDDLLDEQAMAPASVDPAGFRSHELKIVDGLLDGMRCNAEHRELGVFDEEILVVCRLPEDHDGCHRGSTGGDRPGWTMTW